MLHLLEPIWLWAIAGIAFPVAIHLWYVREGKTLRIGSVSLLQASTRQRSGIRMPRQLMLLLLRCLLVILLSVILARPAFERTVQAGNKAWLLIDRGLISQAYNTNKRLIDSLIKAGSEFHYFEAGFPRGDIEKEIRSHRRTDSLTAKNTFTLLAQVDAIAPPGNQLWIFSTTYLRDFEGKRPALKHRVSFLPVSPEDSASTWAAYAYLTDRDSVAVIEASSTANGLVYTKEVMSDRERRTISQPSVAVDSNELKVIIYSDGGEPGSKYFKAAIEAIKDYTGRRIKIIQAETSTYNDQETDWVFWLSDAPIPACTAKHIFMYENGKTLAEHSWLHEAGVINPDELIISKRVVVADSILNGKEIIWQDGYGNPILVRDDIKDKSTYRFLSRVEPAWSEISWSEKFPSMLLAIMFEEYRNDPERLRDKRRIDAELLQYKGPELHNAYPTSTPKEVEDLRFEFWLSAFLIFLLERILTWYQQMRA